MALASSGPSSGTLREGSGGLTRHWSPRALASYGGVLVEQARDRGDGNVIHHSKILRPLKAGPHITSGGFLDPLRSRLTNQHPTVVLLARSDMEELEGLAASNASVWAEKELEIYIEDQKEIFGPIKKIAMLCDPSTYQGEETLLGIMYSWERDKAGILCVQVQLGGTGGDGA